jgi:DNA-binding NarL/FixJ family response regulator
LSIPAPAVVSRPTGELRGNPRLLIADDDRFVQSALHAQLGRTFDIVGTAKDANEAIAQAAALEPDVIILDVQMPFGGGPRAAREIHACAPGAALVALSSDESDDVVRTMIDAGAVTYVRKGMDSAKLIGLLFTAIAAHAELSRYEARIADSPPAS